jgi:hypothetical protein
MSEVTIDNPYETYKTAEAEKETAGAKGGSAPAAE